MILFVAFHFACYLSGYYVYPDSTSLWSELPETIGSQTRQHSSLDEQAVSCYTEEKQSQESEGDEKDTLCVSWEYLPQLHGRVRDESVITWRCYR